MKGLYILIVPTLSEESAITMSADEDPVANVPKNLPPCGRSHVCAHGVVACTYSCKQWLSSYLWWRLCEKET